MNPSHTRLLKVLIVFLGLHVCVISVQSQNIVDSITLSGTLQWRDTSIKRFPKEVKIRSAYDPTFVTSAQVDSLGNYTTQLPKGTYLISPSLKYHFQRNWDQSFVRIDDQKSRLIVPLDRPSEENTPVLLLDTLGFVNTIPDKGILTHFNNNSISLLDEFITQQLDYYQVPGASIALLKKGKVLYVKSYGVKNPITQEAITDSTLFEAGSITKLAFSYAVMRLVEKGIIDLDRPLYKDLVFDAVAHDERHKLITARYVLSHQTGFPNWAKKDENGQFDLVFTPGSKYGYSGEGFEYLKRVIEHITKKNIQTILEEELITPLGLNNFHFYTTNKVIDNATDSFYRGRPTKIRHIKKPMVAYSLVTNAKDFTTFALALRNKKGLKSKTYDQWLKEQVVVEDGIAWGLGLALREDNAGKFYGHSGVTRDFVSNFRYYPDLDIGFVFFTNNITGGWLTIDLLHQFLITGVEN